MFNNPYFAYRVHQNRKVKSIILFAGVRQESAFFEAKVTKQDKMTIIVGHLLADML